MSVTDNKGLGTPTWILQDLGSDILHPPPNSKFDIAYQVNVQCRIKLNNSKRTPQPP